MTENGDAATANETGTPVVGQESEPPPDLTSNVPGADLLYGKLCNLMFTADKVMDVRAETSVVEARKIAGWMLYQMHLQLYPGRAVGTRDALDQLLKKVATSNELPRRVEVQFRTIQLFGNFVNHPRAEVATLSVHDAGPCFAALNTAVRWFVRDRLGIGAKPPQVRLLAAPNPSPLSRTVSRGIGDEPPRASRPSLPIAETGEADPPLEQRRPRGGRVTAVTVDAGVRARNLERPDSAPPAAPDANQTGRRSRTSLVLAIVSMTIAIIGALAVLYVQR